METLEQYIVRHTKNKEKSLDFSEYLSSLLKERGYEKDSDFYNKANITKQTWHVIMSGKSNPSLETALKIVFTLKLNNHECKYLLKKAGYTLASSSRYALIIRYCIENNIYEIWKVNEYLKANGFRIIE